MATHIFLNFLVILTNFCWGIWGILDKKALDHSNERSVLLIQYCLALPEVLLLILWVVFFDKSIVFNSQVLMWGAIGSFTATVAAIAYTVAMSKTEASYVLGITASYPVVVQFLATAFLHEALVPMRVAGAALICSGVVAVGWSGGETSKTHTARDRRIISLCVIVATIGWGVHGLFDKKAVLCGAPTAVMIARAVVDFLVFLVMFAIMKRFRMPASLIANGKTWLLCSLSAAAMMVGYFSSLIAMTQLSASYVVVITGCYPILMYLFALVFLKEKLNLMRLGGVVLVVAGGILVQFTQG